MKAVLRYSLVLLLVVLGACAADEERTWPLCGDLEAFTVAVPGDTARLIGIRHRLTGDTLAGGLCFARVEADTFVVRATLPDGRIMAFSSRGLSIGGRLYDSFTRLQWNDSIDTSYYIATAYKHSYYYFPRQRRTIKIDNARRIVDLRNFVIHGYDKVDNVIIWGILSKDLPKLKLQVDELMSGQTVL